MHGGGGGKADPNLTPLLDLVLQLIMFFLITINFVASEQFAEGVNLPVAQQATPLDQTAEKFVFLNINKNGSLSGALKGEPFSKDPEQHFSEFKAWLGGLRETLEREAKVAGLKSTELKIAIVLRADGSVPYRRIYAILDTCSRAGYRRWQLRVMTEGKKS